MEKYIDFENPDQIINMGGPWIGTLIINNKNVSDNIIIDNYFEKEGIYYFVKYFGISKKQKDNYFTVFRVNTTSLNFEIELSNEKFDTIYIENIEDNLLYYYDGFHTNLPVKTINITFKDDI